MAQWQSRIVEQREMSPGELTAHPANWRTHPKLQADALSGALAEVGLVQGVIFNRRTRRLLDGHLRVKLALENRQATIPVTVVDLDEREELAVLASLDPIAAMAHADREKLDAILDELRVEDERLSAFLERQRAEDDLSGPDVGAGVIPTRTFIFEVPEDEATEIDGVFAMAREGKKLSDGQVFVAVCKVAGKALR